MGFFKPKQHILSKVIAGDTAAPAQPSSALPSLGGPPFPAALPLPTTSPLRVLTTKGAPLPFFR